MASPFKAELKNNRAKVKHIDEGTRLKRRKSLRPRFTEQRMEQRETESSSAGKSSTKSMMTEKRDKDTSSFLIMK
jgi:hypothetical protein